MSETKYETGAASMNMRLAHETGTYPPKAVDKTERLALLESFARVLGKAARYNDGSYAAMLACDLGRDLDNYLPPEDVNAFFLMFQQKKEYFKR